MTLPGREEYWNDVKDYEGIYQVSNLGRVKSLDRIEPTTHSRTGCRVFRERKGKVLRLNTHRGGYKIIVLHKKGVQNSVYVHRLVATAFLTNPNNLPEVNHKDGDPSNNSVENLEWVTRKENALHSTRVLKKNVGESSGTSKLKVREVLEIMDHLSKGESQVNIAKLFGVTSHCIHRIAKGYNWSWVTGYGKEGK